MSTALYEFGGLRFWNDTELMLRDSFQNIMVSGLTTTLYSMNAAWRIYRTEGPCLTPPNLIGESYTDDDIFVTNHQAGNAALCLRAETTTSTFAAARQIGGKKPLCVWQVGKSFRRELSDGATASKLRFLEFTQLEFQCIYSTSTKADYREALIALVEREVGRFSGKPTRVIPSDRTPLYAESTIDIEVEYNGRWMEIASCSIRTDYHPDCRVAEIAIGLDRLVEVSQKQLLTMVIAYASNMR